QAEDGIRDFQVTGVQTCALPICNFGLLDNMEWQGERVGPRDTLVLLNAHKMLRGQRLDNLLSWVEKGGTVITSTNNPFVGNEGSDPLLDQFGITVNESEDQPFTEQTDENTSSPDASEDSATDKASTEIGRASCRER